MTSFRSDAMRRTSDTIASKPNVGWNQRGATSVEYALVASVVSITAIGALMVLGGQVGTLYGLLKHLCDAIASAIAG